jgi:hypothetical protein
MRLACLERVKMISPSRQYLLQVGPEGKLAGALPEMVNKTMTNRLLFLAETCFWWVYHESNPILILKPSELITNFIVYEVIWIQGRRYRVCCRYEGSKRLLDVYRLVVMPQNTKAERFYLIVSLSSEGPMRWGPARLPELFSSWARMPGVRNTPVVAEGRRQEACDYGGFTASVDACKAGDETLLHQHNLAGCRIA